MKILSVFTHLEECFNQTDLKIFAMLRGEHSKNTEDLLARHRTPNHSFQAQWQKWLGVCPGFAVYVCVHYSLLLMCALTWNGLNKCLHVIFAFCND